MDQEGCCKNRALVFYYQNPNGFYIESMLDLKPDFLSKIFTKTTDYSNNVYKMWFFAFLSINIDASYICIALYSP